MGIRKTIPASHVTDKEIPKALSEIINILNPVLKDCIRQVDVPTSETAIGEVGEFAITPTTLYVCVSKNRWKQLSLHPFGG